MDKDWLAEVRERRLQKKEQDRLAEQKDKEKLKNASETRVAWLCASTDTRRDKYANEMAGRKVHAVRYLPGESNEDIKYRRSICGRRAKHGWCTDLHNALCERCAAKMGVDWRGR